MNDKDGKECLKIIDAAGQQIILENNSSEPLDRRGNRTNPPKTASMTLKTNGNLNLDCNFCLSSILFFPLYNGNSVLPRVTNRNL